MSSWDDRRIERQARARKDHEAQLAQLERRLRWSRDGRSAEDLLEGLVHDRVWTAGAPLEALTHLLRELAADGRAHERDGLWRSGPDPSPELIPAAPPPPPPEPAMSTTAIPDAVARPNTDVVLEALKLLGPSTSRRLADHLGWDVKMVSNTLSSMQGKRVQRRGGGPGRTDGIWALPGQLPPAPPDPVPPPPPPEPVVPLRRLSLTERALSVDRPHPMGDPLIEAPTVEEAPYVPMPAPVAGPAYRDTELARVREEAARHFAEVGRLEDLLAETQEQLDEAAEAWLELTKEITGGSATDLVDAVSTVRELHERVDRDRAASVDSLMAGPDWSLVALHLTELLTWAPERDQWVAQRLSLALGLDQGRLDELLALQVRR